jgi:hypothetical protein
VDKILSEAEKAACGAIATETAAVAA